MENSQATKRKFMSDFIKLSASSIKAYDQCPKKYYFNYIEHAPKKQWDHFDLGNICHETLEIFHNTYLDEGTKKKKTYANIMSYAFSEARKNIGVGAGQSILSEAKNILADYLDNIKKNGMPNVQGTEIPFELEIHNNVLIRGVIDRIDILKDGMYQIVDYKTTKNTKYLDEFQLTVYGLWLLKEHPEVNHFRGEYVLLRHKSSSKGFDFNKVDVDKVKKKIISYADKIKEENVWSTIPSPLCNWCDFKEICPSNKAW